MSKGFRWFVVPVALFFVVGAIWAAPVQLSMKLQKGDAWESVVTGKGKGSASVRNQEMPFDFSMSMRADSEVVGTAPGGEITVKWTFRELKVGGMAGMPGEMDLAQMLGLNDKPINLIYDEEGRVIKAEGLENLSSSGMPGNIMSNQRDFDFPLLPDKPVDIGETWQGREQTSLPGSTAEGDLVRTYVLRGIKEKGDLRVAVIGLNEKSSFKNATMTLQAPAGQDMKMEYNIKSMVIEKDGEMLFDFTKGRVLGSRVLVKINQDLSLSAPGRDQALNMKTEIAMEIDEVRNYSGQETPGLSDLYMKKRVTATPEEPHPEESAVSASPSSVPARVAQVKADMRKIADALEMFFIDNDRYPLPLEGRTIDKAGLKLGEGPNVRILRLDSPVAYLSSFPSDPFDPEGGVYRYFSDGSSYVLVSNGPDGKPDYDERQYKGEKLIDLKEYLYSEASGEEGAGDIVKVGP